jgi:O-antigen ligase
MYDSRSHEGSIVTDAPFDIPQPPLAPLPAARWNERLALRVLQIGAIACVLAVTTIFLFDLDRFFVPKELVLHVTACLAGLLLLPMLARNEPTRVERLLALYVGLSALSALFATNGWIAFRALALTISAVILLRCARALREAGLARGLITALAVAVVIAVLTALVQAYGIESRFFATTRAPGGTLGNRNFIAHAAAFSLPLVLLAALRARSRRRFRVGASGVMLLVAVLVLTRSRAAWLALAAVLLVLATAMLASRALRRDRATWRRLAGIALFAGAALALSLIVPNALHWRGSNPYATSIKHVTDYKEGSGRGRLVQYERSLRMALHHPLLGVGPGNWPVEYPQFALRGDPSMSDTEGGMTANPWPSSDWVAVLSERGLGAFLILVLVFCSLAFSAMRQLRSAQTAEEAMQAAALLGTLAAAAVAGTFDALLLLALPTLLVWTAIGALAVPDVSRARVHPRTRSIIALLMVIAAGVAAFRSAAQLQAMNVCMTRSDRASLLAAAQLDPGNYRLQLRLARSGRRAERCEHALAAHALFPHADAARAAAASCGR